MISKDWLFTKCAKRVPLFVVFIVAVGGFQGFAKFRVFFAVSVLFFTCGAKKSAPEGGADFFLIIMYGFELKWLQNRIFKRKFNHPKDCKKIERFRKAKALEVRYTGISQKGKAQSTVNKFSAGRRQTGHKTRRISLWQT